MKHLLQNCPNVYQTGRRGIFILVTLLQILLLTAPANSQLKDKSIKSGEKDFFFVDPIVFYNREELKPRLDVYIEIPLDNLQFKKNYDTKNYDASINFNIKITNSFNEIVSNENVSDYITTTKAQQKRLDETAKFIVKEFYLNPGSYKLEITLNDINTKIEKLKTANVTIDDYSQKDISFSDIMLVSKLKEESGKKVITPLVDKNIDNLKELFLFFEVYNSGNQDVVNNFTYRVTGANEKIYEKGNYTFTLLPGTNKFFEKIPLKNLVFGNYKIEINDNTSGLLLAEKEFSNKLTGFPGNTKDLGSLVDQLLYIATGEELSKIKDASTPELKEKYFIEFWRSKDPSPNTSKNELMREYYKRIKIANERYSHYVDGWKTDMGMVFIIFGEPGNIQRYPFSENTKPYEIWDYYNDNRQFVFVDDTGFGDYKLTTPIWDESQTRIKY